MSAGLNFTVPLFVPGNRPERFSKAAASGADAIIIDLEDAVAAGDKQAARANLRTDFTDLPVLVRVNAANTPWHIADLASLRALPLCAVVIPKAEFGDNLRKIAADSRIPVIALIETARGIFEADAIAALPGVSRIAFGSVDFCADLGCAHTREALLAARSRLVLASRLAGLLPPIDGVTTSVDDTSLIVSDARYACELGFSAKLCIHPRQVEFIRLGLQPNDAEIRWAHKVLASGEGAAAVDGAMVDEPVRIRARATLARASSQPAAG